MTEKVESFLKIRVHQLWPRGRQPTWLKVDLKPTNQKPVNMKICLLWVGNAYMIGVGMVVMIPQTWGQTDTGNEFRPFTLHVPYILFLYRGVWFLPLSMLVLVVTGVWGLLLVTACFAFLLSWLLWQPPPAGHLQQRKKYSKNANISFIFYVYTIMHEQFQRI
jgi:hypothetical protein